MADDNINPLNPQEDPTLPDNAGGGGQTGDAGTLGGTDTAPSSDDPATRIATLEAELAETKKRVSGQTRANQEERAAREKAEVELKKYDKYKEIIDFSELDEMVGGEKPTQSQIKPVLDSNVQNRIGSLEVMVLESNFAMNNPDKAFVFKEGDLKKATEGAAVEIMQQEISEYGRVVSKPEEILGKAVDKTISFVNKLRAEGAKSVTEQRTKIESSGVDLGGGETTGKAFDEDEDKPLGTDDYISLQRQIHTRTKTVVPPDKKPE